MMLRVIGGYALLLLVGCLDMYTGPEVRFGSFYLLLITLFGWSLGRRQFIVYAVATIGIWVGTELINGPHHTKGWIVYWNTLNKVGSAVISAIVILKVKRTLVQQWDLICELRQTSLKMSSFGEMIPICRLCGELHLDDAYKSRLKTVISTDTDEGTVGDICPDCIDARVRHLSKIPIAAHFQ